MASSAGETAFSQLAGDKQTGSCHGSAGNTLRDVQYWVIRRSRCGGTSKTVFERPGCNACCVTCASYAPPDREQPAALFNFCAICHLHSDALTAE